MQDALGELFNSKQVWLLLDGVDEMVMGTQSHTPLQWIANQFTGWVGNAQVVLTCRLNLWDVGKNALEAFETYRNLDFSYGDVQTSDQVGQFIRRWFQGSPHLAERLRAELNQPGKERIKDTVKNPLRLALLCRSWALGQGKLPNTKARLYQQFTEAVYEWKKDQFPTNSSQRQELNRALGELALKAISEEKTKFRLRHHFVCSVLGEPDTALFRLALQLGWLNQVGVVAEAEDLGKNVYAFYHPTFQEYFAALAIEDWHYFLNHSRDNLAQGTYRIFEPQWKEVILLWLGREDVVKEQKESFLEALVEFEDECKDFYRYQAYFLAAAGISEFGDCGRASEIVDPGNQEVIKVLVELISSAKYESVRIETAFRLWEIDPGNQEVIKVLVELISSAKDESVRIETAFRLWEIDPGNQEVIKVLVELISSAKDESVRSKTAFRLEQISPGNQEAIKVLVELISSTKDESIRIETAFRLWEIDPGNQEVIKVLVELISSAKDESVRIETAFRLWEIDPGNQEVIKVLVELISSAKDESVRSKTAFRLWQIDPRRNQEAIKVLVELISSTKDESIRKQAAFRLEEINRDNRKPIKAPIKSPGISPKGGKSTKINPHELHLALKGIDLMDINTNLIRLFDLVMSSGTICGVSRIGKAEPEMIRTLVQLIGSSEDESARREAIQHLRRIGTDNIRDKILPQLIHLLNKSPEKEYKRRVSDSLAVAALVQLIESSEDEFARIEATESLGKIGRGNPEAIAALMQLIKPTENEPTSLQEDKSIRRQATYSLKKILRDDQLAGIVTDLKNYLSDEIYKNDTEQFEEYYKLIWHCAQIMSYPDFFLAWQNEPTLL
jgi:HEAT repeat protein